MVRMILIVRGLIHAFLFLVMMMFLRMVKFLYEDVQEENVVLLDVHLMYEVVFGYFLQVKSCAPLKSLYFPMESLFGKRRDLKEHFHFIYFM